MNSEASWGTSILQNMSANIKKFLRLYTEEEFMDMKTRVHRCSMSSSAEGASSGPMNYEVSHSIAEITAQRLIQTNFKTGTWNDSREKRIRCI